MKLRLFPEPLSCGGDRVCADAVLLLCLYVLERYWGRQSNPGDAAGYDWTYGTVPLVDRFKYDTAGEYMTNMCER